MLSNLAEGTVLNLLPVLVWMSVDNRLCMFAEERQSPELYASNVRKVMGDALGADFSSHGIPQQQALKRNGIYVDWTGRYVSLLRRHYHAADMLHDQTCVSKLCCKVG